MDLFRAPQKVQCLSGGLFPSSTQKFFIVSKSLNSLDFPHFTLVKNYVYISTQKRGTFRKKTINIHIAFRQTQNSVHFKTDKKEEKFQKILNQERERVENTVFLHN